MLVELESICCVCHKLIEIKTVEMEDDDVREGETSKKRVSHTYCSLCATKAMEEVKNMN